MSWYWLRIADKKHLLTAFSHGEHVLASPVWHRLDLIASPAIICATEALLSEVLGAERLAGGLVAEGTVYDVLDCFQQIYERAEELSQGARIAEEIIRRYDLNDELVIDFYEPAIHPGIEPGWSDELD